MSINYTSTDSEYCFLFWILRLREGRHVAPHTDSPRGCFDRPLLLALFRVSFAQGPLHFQKSHAEITRIDRSTSTSCGFIHLPFRNKARNPVTYYDWMWSQCSNFWPFRAYRQLVILGKPVPWRYRPMTIYVYGQVPFCLQYRWFLVDFISV